MQIAYLSEPLKAVVARRLASTRLTVQAGLTGDRALFVEALLVDGAVTDRGVASAMGEELLQAQHAYLPSFFA